MVTVTVSVTEIAGDLKTTVTELKQYDHHG